jgi:hypothetical protein
VIADVVAFSTVFAVAIDFPLSKYRRFGLSGAPCATYRAYDADQQAWYAALRPKRCLLSREQRVALGLGLRCGDLFFLVDSE